ncbi:hypothetical protein ISN44_As09g024890 [Arabidopsis suecica]|uniref:Uncharacterized protein n=1 Tax=Arabidopsis suecica TaxID=45249 RepID=A0A8T2ALH7_ARASU|nr:hypothetical protein ISN44_As09g024890 [Arabidopsis suecica]
MGYIREPRDFALFSHLYLSERKSSEFSSPVTAASSVFVSRLSVRNLLAFSAEMSGFRSDIVRFSLRRWSAYVQHPSVSTTVVGWLMSRVSPSVSGVSSSFLLFLFWFL